jgi:hypothetical protein
VIGTPKCAKCGRPWKEWPVKRPAVCAPASWWRCIRPDDAIRRGEK